MNLDNLTMDELISLRNKIENKIQSYEDWEIIEKLLWSENGLHTKLEAAFTGFFDKVYMRSPKTPETYIKAIKSLSKFGNRI